VDATKPEMEREEICMLVNTIGSKIHTSNIHTNTACNVHGN